MAQFAHGVHERAKDPCVRFASRGTAGANEVRPDPSPALMRDLRQRPPSALIGVYALVFVWVLVGAPGVIVADALFGTTTAEWVFAGVMLVALAVGLVASIGASKLRVERDRRSRGLCPGCGYDVRANPTRCPECGRLILP